MKRYIPLFLLSLLVVCTSCDPIEAIGVEGPKRMCIHIINESGMSVYEKDNWGRCDKEQRIYPSERAIKNDTETFLWNPMDGIQTWEEFIGKLEESCPDAYVELYEYNDSTQEVGRLLKRWSLQDSISGRHFFNLDSHHYSLSNCYEASLGILSFTLLPEDVAGEEE